MPAVFSPRRLLAAACLTAAVAMLAAAVPSHAATMKRCDIRGKERRLGATYVTSLKVSGTSCAAGERVVKAFQRCRRASGLRGRCTRRVLRFRCVERRPAAERIPTQFTGRVTCSSATRRVAFVYQQNT